MPLMHLHETEDTRNRKKYTIWHGYQIEVMSKLLWEIVYSKWYEFDTKPIGTGAAEYGAHAATGLQTKPSDR